MAEPNRNRTGAPRSPQRTPDFLSSLLALAHSRVLVAPRAGNPDTWAKNDGRSPRSHLLNSRKIGLSWVSALITRRRS